MRGRLAAILMASGTLAGCSSPVTVATFNIRYFPEPSTDPSRVAQTIADLDASVIAVQEIRDALRMGAVLEEASRIDGRDYHLLLGPCGGAGERITTGVVYDAAQWTVVEHLGYPDLRSDGRCVRQPGTLAVLQDQERHRLAVLSVHLPALPHRFDERREQWNQVLARMDEIERRHPGAPVLALGDFNSTGFRGEPAEERPFVEEAVARAGYALPTADLSCTEYWRPPNEPESYWPSVLDHGVVAGGRFGEAEVRGMCERLRCQPTEADAMDPDFAAVSDHCPVVLRGTL
ncbi:MAG: endonuclease/exonuclease/phosphatase family protein [Myxococcales bacterium]|nr:endonuclease/exonuclease/phosphatase family protein [Myxococcales bacterium]MCB9718411.1 endonuclease/exonuclease/phosphatase family protein [Myxococcales bacterium]